MRLLRVSAEIVSKHKMLLKRPASRRTDIEVMWNVVNRRKESLPIRNTESSLMDITQLRKMSDNRGKRGFVCQKHINIDNGLGR